MAWLTTTRWKDTQVDNVEQAIELMMEENNTINTEGTIAYKNLTKHKKFAEIKKMTYNNQEVCYNLIEFTIDSITPGDEIEESRTSKINGLILIYQVGNSVRYLINRNYDALRLLRMIRGFGQYDARGEIEKDNTDMSSDIFMWFVKIVYQGDNTLIFTQENQTERSLTIESILGVRSETRDENKLSAQGNTVMNLISTLSFILESDKINQLILRINYANHEVIEIKLTSKGVISCEIDSYSGEYEELDRDSLTCKLLLLVYMEIIPSLKHVFYNDVDSGNWNKDKKEKFFQNIKSELVERLEERSKNL